MTPEKIIQEVLADRVGSLESLLFILFRIIGIVAAGCFLGLAVYLAILLSLH
jgi:hypothetical protein